MINPATRREFLTLAAATTAALATWRCGGDGGSQPVTRTMFFNFRHETDADDATYHLIVGGRRHPLLRVHEQRGVLDQARQTNTFLQNVPDDSVTHVIPSIISPGNEIQIAYVMKNRDLTTGLWSMTSMFFVLPLGAVVAAHQLATRTGRPLALSAKRRKYGLAAAQTEQDFLEEEFLADTTDHATALVSFHNELLSGHPGSAAYIQKNLVQGSEDIFQLKETIENQKEAMPELTPGMKNPTGWATLVAYRDDVSGQPLRAKIGRNQGLILYNPEWHPEVQTKASLAITDVLQQAKDDTSLGADVTSAIGGGAPPPLDGTIWHRRDGVTTVEQSGFATAEASSDVLTITPSTPFAGYSCDATIASGTPTDSNPMVTIKLANWYLRWLGVWVEFIGAGGGPILVKDITKEPFFTSPLVHTETAIFLGALAPEWTLYGIPLEETTLSLTFPFPAGDGATSAKVIASGLGNGSIAYADTIAVGAGLTVLFNLLAPPVLVALGAGESLDVFEKGIKTIVADSKLFVDAATKVFLGTGDASFVKKIGTLFGKALAREVAGDFIKAVVTEVVEIVAEDAAVDCIPLIGQIVEAIGAIGAAAEVIETSAEVGTSPWTYQSVLTPTHSPSCKIVPDPNDNGPPTTPDGANECIVTALFDSGATPRVVNVPLSAPQHQVDVSFASVPLGGNITVSAGFYQAERGRPHTLLGRATSGLVQNTSDNLPNLVITRIPHPITINTSYAHVRKTILDANTGQHTWQATTTPPTETQDTASGSNLCQQQAGSLCKFGGITVRQASGPSPGYLGYAWQGFGSGCGGGSGGFDRLSNVNTGDSAEAGYATVSCGLPSGARVAYSLLGDPPDASTGQTGSNFYIEPGTDPEKGGVLRRIQLGTTPKFEDPNPNPDPMTSPGEAWGQLNFPSDALLLHPTGIIVSVSNAKNRLETLVVPAASVTDAVAKTDLLANVHGGLGSRPGLLTSPIAAAVAPGGVIIVLEAGDANADPPVPPRIQAFDIGGNSVPFFKNLPDPHFLTLTATAGSDTTHLDIAVEHTGFIYVLSYKGGTSPFDYRLDIYAPDQSDTNPISTTHGFNAARIAVDFWRNVYALNYEVLRKQPGNTLPALTEPTVSEWGPQGA